MCSLDVIGINQPKLKQMLFWNGSLEFADCHTNFIFYYCLLKFKVLRHVNIWKDSFTTTTRKIGRKSAKELLLVFVYRVISFPLWFELRLQLTFIQKVKEICWKMWPLWCQHINKYSYIQGVNYVWNFFMCN